MNARAAKLLCALALALAVWLVYAPVRTHDFVRYDDDVYLLENPHVADGLTAQAAGYVFTHEYAANYHPLTWLAHMLDVELFGLAPGPHHLVNVALHALNAVLVLYLLAALLANPWAAAVGAALFALHPLRVESVAWASERKDVLCALFFLLACLAALAHLARPSRARFAALCLAFVLALLSKPMAVTFPLVFLLLARCAPARAAPRPRAAVVRETLLLFALAALAAGVTLWAQGRGGSTSSLAALAPELRVLNALRSLWVYLAQSLAPRCLAVFYPHAAIVAPAPLQALLGPAALGLGLLAAGGLLAWRQRRAAPLVTLGLALYLVMLLPVLGLVQVGTQAHADRYTYLPSLGLVLALLGFVQPWTERHGRTLAALGTTAALVLAMLSRQQLGVWQDTRSLFRHALACDERNYLAHSKLGELALAADQLDAAEIALTRALTLHPGFLEARNNLALVYLGRGELERAQRELERLLALEPDEYDTWLNLGAVALERGDLAAARERFEACLARAPLDADARFNLGNLAQRAGQPAEAERRYREALARAPEHADAWSNLGQVYLGSGRVPEALEAFERAALLLADDPLAHFNLGVARRRALDLPGAARAFRRALVLAPDFELARAALGELERGG